MSDIAEELLKKTAVTFASEAISSDLKNLLSEKIEYNLQMTRELNQIIESVAHCRDKEVRKLLLTGSSLSEIIQTISDDQKFISWLQTILISTLLKKLDKFGSESEENPSNKKTNEEQWQKHRESYCGKH